MPYGAILEQQGRRRAVERRLEQKTSEVKVPNCGSQGALGGGRYAVCNLCPAENPNPVSVKLLSARMTAPQECEATHAATNRAQRGKGSGFPATLHTALTLG